MALALALLCLMGLGPPAQATRARQAPDQGGVGIQLLDAPEKRRADPRARQYIVDHLPPGTVIHRRVRIVNKSSFRRHIEVYPGAATVDGGHFRFGAGRAANELTTWISLDRGELDLRAYAEASVVVTIKIPPPASAAERYAVIWASAAPDPRTSGQIARVYRAGIRVYLDIGAGGEPSTDFAVSRLVAARNPAGEPTVDISVTNTGGRALDLTGNVTLTDGPAGTRAGPFRVTMGTTLAAGQSGTVSVRFPRDLPNGPWKIHANLASGAEKRSASGTVTFPAAGAPTVTSTLRADTRSEWPALSGGLLIGTVVLAGLVWAARRARSS